MTGGAPTIRLEGHSEEEEEEEEEEKREREWHGEMLNLKINWFTHGK
jgi:hypothetical protein